MPELKSTNELQNSYVDDCVKNLIPKFEALAPYSQTQRKKGKDGTDGWHKLALLQSLDLKCQYPDDRPENQKEFGSALRQVTALKKALSAAVKDSVQDPALRSGVTTIIKNFGNELSNQFAVYKLNQNIRYRDKVEVRRQPENRIKVNVTSSLEYFDSILRSVAAGDDESWLDVSCAIALATGRRMAEVHLSGIFSPVDDYVLTFRGQLKGKDRKVKVGSQSVSLIKAEFEIPTLLRADLVAAGIEYLDANGKRFDATEDPERVNRRFSKTLNLHCKKFDIFPPDERTYHKFRAAYFRCAIALENIDPYDYGDYAKKILGDDDMATIASYQRYQLSPGKYRI